MPPTNPNLNDPAALSARLCDAAGNGDLKTMQEMLAAGADPNGFWDPEAARKKAIEFQKSMAEYTRNLPSPLDGLDEETRKLIEPGLDESMKAIEAEMIEQSISAPSDFEIPLFCAAEADALDCVNALLNAGADATRRDSSERTAVYQASSEPVLRRLVDAGADLNATDQFGWNALVNAVQGGVDERQKMRALIACGADVNGQHDRGFTVFMSAASSMERHVDILKYLVDAGADPHAVTDLGYNAFHAAIDVNGEANEESSVRSTLEFLKELGVNINHRDERGWSPLALAILEGTATEVRTLCDLGADVNAAAPMYNCGTDESETCEIPSECPLLHIAAEGSGVQRAEKTEALLAYGADPLATDDQGCTALSCLAASLLDGAANHEASFNALFDRLENISLLKETKAVEMTEFLNRLAALAESIVRSHVKKELSAADGEFEAEWREEMIACVVELFTAEAWAWRTSKPEQD